LGQSVTVKELCTQTDRVDSRGGSDQGFVRGSGPWQGSDWGRSPAGEVQGQIPWCQVRGAKPLWSCPFSYKRWANS